jgi:hypothetical protein
MPTARGDLLGNVNNPLTPSFLSGRTVATAASTIPLWLCAGAQKVAAQRRWQHGTESVAGEMDAKDELVGQCQTLRAQKEPPPRRAHCHRDGHHERRGQQEFELRPADEAERLPDISPPQQDDDRHDRCGDAKHRRERRSPPASQQGSSHHL